MLIDSLRETFTDELQKLVRWGANSARITFSHDIGDIKVNISANGEAIAEVSLNEDLLETCFEKIYEKIKETERWRRITMNRALRLLREFDKKLHYLWSRPPSVINDPLYLIAERAGVYRLYRPLFAIHFKTRLPDYLRRYVFLLDREMMEAFERFLGPEIRLPKLADEMLFISLRGRRRMTELGDEVSFLKEIMAGSIELDIKELAIYYKVGRKRIELGLSSSMVTELTPLYLALERMHPTTALIIEEPEAHLHPEAQRQLCRLFVRLVRKNHPILLTTHSGIIPATLAHLVGLANLPSEKRIELGFSAEEFLKYDELGIYWLKQEAEGSILKEVIVSPDGVIEELPEYDDVMEQMYIEEVRIRELSKLVT